MAEYAREEFVPHIWVETEPKETVPGAVPAMEGRLERNLLAFAARHDYALVYTAVVSEAALDPLDERLAAAADAGVDVWLDVWADPEGPSDEELLADDERMGSFLSATEAIAAVYDRHCPGGKMLLWHEFFGNWSGDSAAELADSMLAHGPELFARQRERIRTVNPDIDVGVFPRHAVQAPPDYTTKPVFRELTDRLRDRGALPDFGYVCAYRGYEDWDGGYEATDGYLAAVIDHVRTCLDGAPVYYPAQAHTINNGYTPSRQAMLGSLRTCLDRGMESPGWFVRPNYRLTHRRCYNPYLPNRGTVDAFTSWTGSRDRLRWATLVTREQAADFDSRDYFDLWVYGEHFEHYGNTLWLGGDSGWEFVGDFSGYPGGDNPYAGAGRHRAVAFHALDRSYLDGGLDVRIEGHQQTPATVERIQVMPYFDASSYLTEPEITEHVECTDLGPYRLGHWEGATDLAGDEAMTATVTVSSADRPARDLVYPGEGGTLDRLEDIEASDGFDPRERFDLWVCGRSLGAVEVGLSTSPVDDAVGPVGAGAVGDQYVPLDDYAGPHPAEFEGDIEARVFRGLEKGAFFLPREALRHAHGKRLELGMRARDDVTVSAVYAMPYHGRANYKTEATVARVVERDFEGAGGELTTFSLGHQVWPGNAPLAAGDTLETRVAIPDRRANVVQHVE